MVNDKSSVEPRRGADDHQKHHIGVAWYRREQWNRLLEVSADREDLENTYDEWLAFSEASLERLKREGLVIHKVDVDIDALVRWCGSQNRPVNMESRAEYVVAMLKLREQGTD